MAEYRLSSEGLDFICKWEKYVPVAYKDLAGIWTVGYGSTTLYESDSNNQVTSRIVMEGDTLNEPEARGHILYQSIGICRKLEEIVKVSLNQNSLDSLVSFCYNVGVAGFKSSSLLRAINNQETIVADLFTRWSKAHVDGRLVTVNGLRRRRLEEWNMYMGRLNTTLKA